MAAKVKKRHLTLLRPYLLGEQPRENGEWDMFCPLHEDTKRSASLNVDEGVWFCLAGCGGGRVTQLLQEQENWVDPATLPGAPLNGSGNGNGNGNGRVKKDVSPITESLVKQWRKLLQNDEDTLSDLLDARRISNKTIKRFDIGWDPAQKAYTIPVRNGEGGFWNVRRYQINPPPGRRKIWSHGEGYGSPRLWPIEVFDEDPDEIIVCEGEWDCLSTIDRGFNVVTRTAGANAEWLPEWNEHFRGKDVYLCYDRDEAGLDGTRRAARSLTHVAKSVRIISLPFEVKPKHGEDLTDFWKEGHDADDLRKLMDDAELFGVVEEIDPEDADVLDSFDSRNVGKPLSMTVTIKGKKEPGYSIPNKVEYECTRDQGKKCEACPLFAAGGHASRTIEPSDPMALEFIESSKMQVGDALRESFGSGIPKCVKLEINVSQYMAVETLIARPSVDHMGGTTSKDNSAANYKTLKITSVGRHDTSPNNTVRVTGALYPNPRKQNNEFLAWDINPQETSLDTFQLTTRMIKHLRKFQPAEGQRPLKKVREITDDLARCVTGVYGRPEMHALIHLVAHSVLAFNFAGQRENRGWLEALILGDTRTGKSKAATLLSHHYRVGEVVSCETASIAGILGGLQQFGSGKEWSVTWGVVPINDRRWVILDEVSGLSQEEIAQLSSVRSSGVAELMKINQERTLARTRLLWLGNPRQGARMSDYTYGVQGIRPLIGNPEDIARFDMAMTVRKTSDKDINRFHEPKPPTYTSNMCHSLIQWIYSRHADQILWAPGAEKEVFKQAAILGSQYVEEPPLIQLANVRYKVARLAASIAAATFSTDATHENVVIGRAHVRDAVAFLNLIYGMPDFGYQERSREMLADVEEARGNADDIKQYLIQRRGLAKFLRAAGKFRRQDIEEVMNCSREEANAIINTLWGSRMVRKDLGDIRVEPVLHDILREVKE